MNITTNSSFQENLSMFSGLSWQAILRLAINSFGIVTNAFNLFIFANSKLKSPCYQLMLVKSVSSLLYNIFGVVSEFVSYCNNCQLKMFYFSTLYTLSISSYFTTCLAMFRISIEIVLSIHTFCLLRNKCWTRMRWTILICVSVAIFVCGLQAVRLWANRIVPLTGSMKFFLVIPSSLGLSTSYRIFICFHLSLRVFLAVVLLTTLNILNMIQFSKRFKSEPNQIISGKFSKIVYLS